MVEQRTENPCVPGSIPGGTTKPKYKFGLFYFLAMTTLYFLYSKKKDTYYVGETQNLDLRLSQHNTHTFTKGFTKAAVDWEVVLTYQHSSRTTVLKLERFIKKMKRKVFIQKLIQNPELIEKLILDKKL